VAAALTDVTTQEIERELAQLRQAADGRPAQRTSVMTHMAWVPREWEERALGTLEGLRERHPSRTILLHPDPDAGVDRVDAAIDWQCFGARERHVCAEVIRLWLRGTAASAPASVVLPLQLPDLAVFLRWRGPLPFGGRVLEQLLPTTDRLIVDSVEWPEPSFGELVPLFERTAVSDLAWARTRAWRAELAALWPAIAEARELHVVGPAAEARLLAGWLQSRLGHETSLQHADSDEIDLVVVDGREVPEPSGRRPTASDLLSEELEQYGRDRIYEDAVRAGAHVGLM
jgi:glucose-6-phosphate dehydrogenase assembly protein OpcA